MIVTRRGDSKDAFLSFCAEIPVEEQRRIAEGLAIQGIDFVSDTWRVSGWSRRRILEDRPLRIYFDRAAGKGCDKLGFIKPHVKYLIGKMRLDQGAASGWVLQFLDSMVKLSSFLKSESYHEVSELSDETFQAYEDHILKLTIGEIYKQRCLLHCNYFIRGLNFDIDWRPPRIALSINHRTSDNYVKNLKTKRIPEDVIVQLLSLTRRLIDERRRRVSLGSCHALIDHDLLVCAVMILLIGSYTRVGEILSLENECEFETPQGYALKVITEKSHQPELRTVAPEYVAVIKEILGAVREITDLSRRYTRFWEQRGEIKYVIEKQNLSGSLFCFMKRGEKNHNSYVVTERLLKELISGNMRVTLKGFLNSTAIKPLNKSVIKAASCKLPDLMLHAYKRDEKSRFSLADLSKTLLGTGNLFTYQRFHQSLIRGKSGLPDRHNITHNGTIYHFNSHQIRHYNTTIMLNQGLSMELVDKLHGRITPEQSKAYDHPDYAELFMREAQTHTRNNPAVVIDGHHDVLTMKARPFTVKGDLRADVLQMVKEQAVIGPVARELQRLRGKLQSEEISAADFEHSSWQFMPVVSISPTRLGFCTHAWAESTCSYHYECLCNDKMEVCEKLLPFVHPIVLKRLDEIRKDFAMEAELVKRRQDSPYKAVWERILMAKLKNIKLIGHEIQVRLETTKSATMITDEGDDYV
jgi:hypothetical protein